MQTQSFLEFFPDSDECADLEEKCHKYLTGLRWPNGVTCPFCLESRVGYVRGRRSWSCRKCRRQFSLRTDTILEESRLPLYKWLTAIWVLTDGNHSVGSYDLSSQIGVSKKTAWYMQYRLNRVLPLHYDTNEQIQPSQLNPQVSSGPLGDKEEGASHFRRFEDVLIHTLNPYQAATFINLMEGNCLERFRELDAEAIHLAIVAPPYPDPVMFGFTYPTWARTILGSEEDTASGFGFLPSVQETIREVSSTIAKGMYHSLVPGAFIVFFSQPHLVHHSALGLEGAGLEIINTFVWHHTQNPPAYEPIDEAFLDKVSPFPTERKQARRRLRSLRKPEGDPSLDLLILAQKPKRGSLLDNWRTYQTGLVDIDADLLEQARSGVIAVEKQVRNSEEGKVASKPVELMEYLIKLLSQRGQIIIDPFVGDGNGAIAAYQTERGYIGIDINAYNIDTARKKLAAAGAGKSWTKIPPTTLQHKTV